MYETFSEVKKAYLENPNKEIKKTVEVTETTDEEKSLNEVFRELDEETKNKFLIDFEEFSNEIPNKKIRRYDIIDKATDFLSKGKRFYAFGAFMPISFFTGLYASMNGNPDALMYGTYIMLGSTVPLAASSSRFPYSSMKSKRISELPYSEFENLKEELQKEGIL